eukprot:7318532-Pyramimonas_sp.AAC.1
MATTLCHHLDPATAHCRSLSASGPTCTPRCSPSTAILKGTQSGTWPWRKAMTSSRVVLVGFAHKGTMTHFLTSRCRLPSTAA